MHIVEVRDCQQRLVCKIDILTGLTEYRYKDSSAQMVLDYNTPAIFRRGDVVTVVTRKPDHTLNVHSVISPLVP